MNTSGFQYPFAAPVVPIADPVDGLLQTADLDRPVPVNIVVWDAAQMGDVIQLVLNGERVGEIQTLTDADKSGDIIILNLNEKLLNEEGIYTITFSVTNIENGVVDSSPSNTLRVDRSAPGAALLGPIIFPSVTLGDNLTGQVPSYADMQEGDSIQTVCNGTRGPAHTVVADELVHQPVHVTFERDFLQSLGSETVVAEYFVTDRAGNMSVISLPVSLTLQV